jgi:16S rRNA (guanine1516-N2)-methyltransferase
MNVQIINDQLEKLGFRLRDDDTHLLLESMDNSYKPFYIDFTAGKNQHRRLFGGGKGQPMARAVGLKKGALPSVLDVTAGMGRDAFVLASQGCQVTMLERSPVIAALLENAMQRAMHNDDIAEIIQRMRLCHEDSRVYLEQLTDNQLTDVIYIDPMYPHRDKSALVKKEMRIFRSIVGDDVDSDALLELGRKKALRRVVVKRPKGAAFLSGVAPHSQIASKNTRYDIYLPI